MISMKRGSIILALLVSFSLLGASAVTQAKATSKSNILSQLKSGKETLVIGTDATFPPFEFTNLKGQKIGFDINLVSDIMKQIGIRHYVFQQVPFDELVPDLEAHHIGMAASAIYITPSRGSGAIFSKTYFPGGLTIMVNSSNTTIHSLKDLAGKKVAVQIGTKSVTWLKQHVPSAQEVIVQTNDQMFQSVQDGQADAVVTGYPAARYYIKIHGHAKTVGHLLTQEHYGFAFRKSDGVLVKAVNAALTKLQKNGTVKKLEMKWFGAASQ